MAPGLSVLLVHGRDSFFRLLVLFQDAPVLLLSGGKTGAVREGGNIARIPLVSLMPFDL